jgi:hypothetical protein
MLNIRCTFDGDLPLKSKESVEKLKMFLINFFPEEKYFPKDIVDLTSDVDSEDENSSTGSVPLNFVPSPVYNPFQPIVDPATKSKPKPIPRKPLMQSTRAMAQNSIAAYKTKTDQLKPASHYAKPAGEKLVERKIISVPYKNEIKPKTQTYDPREVAIKLETFKDRMKKTLLKDEKKEESRLEFPKLEDTSTQQQSSSNSSKDLLVIPCKNMRNAKQRRMTICERSNTIEKFIDEPRKLRPRTKSVYNARNNAEDNCVPIQQSQNPVRKGRKPQKSPTRLSKRLKSTV